MGFSAFKLVATGADGKSIRNTHNQDNHPFKAGQVVRFIIGDGGGWTAASASDSIQAEATGIIEEVVSGSEFVVVYQGEINTAGFANGYGVTGGGSDDDVWFLSAGASAGRLENVAPTEGGNVIKPMLIKQSGAVGLVTGYIGTVIGGKQTVSIDDLCPVGTIHSYAGLASDVPQSWSLCNGQALLVSEFGDYYNRVAHRYGFYQTLSFGSGDTSIQDLTDYLTTGTIVFEQVPNEGTIVRGNLLSWDNDTKKASVDIEYLDAAEIPNGKSFDKDKSVLVTHTATSGGAETQWTFNIVTNATVTHVKTPDLQGRVPMGVGNYNPTNSDYVLGQMGGLDELILDEDNVNTTDIEVGSGEGEKTVMFFKAKDLSCSDATDGGLLSKQTSWQRTGDSDGSGGMYTGNRMGYLWGSGTTQVPNNASGTTTYDLVNDFGVPPEATHAIITVHTWASFNGGDRWDIWAHRGDNAAYSEEGQLAVSIHGELTYSQASSDTNTLTVPIEDGKITLVLDDHNGPMETESTDGANGLITGYIVPASTSTISEGDGGSEPFSNIQPFLASNYIIRTKSEAAVSIIDKIDIPDNSLLDHNTPAPQLGDILAYYHDGVAGSSGEYRNFKLFDGISADGTDEDFVRIDMANKKVGIGTTTPGATLDVKGDIWVTDPNSSNVAIKLYGENDVDTVPDIEFYARALLTAGNSITLGMDKDDATTDKFFSVQKNSNVLQTGNANEIFRLTESGRLGIGSTDGAGGIDPDPRTSTLLLEGDGFNEDHITLQNTTNNSSGNGASEYSKIAQHPDYLKIATSSNGVRLHPAVQIGPGLGPVDTDLKLEVDGKIKTNDDLTAKTLNSTGSPMVLNFDTYGNMTFLQGDSTNVSVVKNPESAEPNGVFQVIHRLYDNGYISNIDQYAVTVTLERGAYSNTRAYAQVYGTALNAIHIDIRAYSDGQLGDFFDKCSVVIHTMRPDLQ
jgi:microcystin-dependent protein